MTDRSSDSPPSPPPAPPGWTDTRGPAPLDAQTPLTRFLGGSPANVAMRLFFVSLIVGALFMWLDIRPADVLRGLTDLFDRISRLGFDAIREVINYVLVGAAVVVPIWLVLRLLNMRGK